MDCEDGVAINMKEAARSTIANMLNGKRQPQAAGTACGSRSDTTSVLRQPLKLPSTAGTRWLAAPEDAGPSCMHSVQKPFVVSASQQARFVIAQGKLCLIRCKAVIIHLHIL